MRIIRFVVHLSTPTHEHFDRSRYHFSSKLGLRQVHWMEYGSDRSADQVMVYIPLPQHSHSSTVRNFQNFILSMYEKYRAGEFEIDWRVQVSDRYSRLRRPIHRICDIISYHSSMRELRPPKRLVCTDVARIIGISSERLRGLGVRASIKMLAALGLEVWIHVSTPVPEDRLDMTLFKVNSGFHW